jgi:bifunctional non-homologous end joining protein LigD
MAVSVAGVALTHADRVLYPEQGMTKRDLAEYYRDVSGRILPHVAGRPLTLVRCPRGRGGSCFYQRHVRDTRSRHVHGIPVRERGSVGVYVSIDDLPGLISLVQLGVLEIHPWASRGDDLERSDRMIFDLDPGPELPWASVVAGARELRERLERVGLESFVRLSGGKGVHVVVPLRPGAEWGRVKAFSRSIAEVMEADAPGLYVASASRAKRGGRIFLDYLRNIRGATAVASYSTRARPGAPVATPLRWNELTPAVMPDRYSTGSVRRRLAALGEDPWAGFFEVRQTLDS